MSPAVALPRCVGSDKRLRLSQTRDQSTMSHNRLLPIFRTSSRHLNLQVFTFLMSAGVLATANVACSSPPNSQPLQGTPVSWNVRALGHSKSYRPTPQHQSPPRPEVTAYACRLQSQWARFTCLPPQRHACLCVKSLVP